MESDLLIVEEKEEANKSGQIKVEPEQAVVRRKSARVSKSKSGSEVLRSITQITKGVAVSFSGEMPSSDDTMYQDESASELHRCLIFGQHTRVLDLIEKDVLQRYFPTVPYVRMDGSTPPVERAEIARRFNDQMFDNDQADLPTSPREAAKEEGSYASNTIAIQRILRSQRQNSRGDSASRGIRILLMTSRSCGLGLNLTAADTVIFVQHDWNPFVDLQVQCITLSPTLTLFTVSFYKAMDRCHRLGQKKIVTVYRLLAESTIEARIAAIQNLKKIVADEVIKEDNAKIAEGASLGSVLWSSLVGE